MILLFFGEDGFTKRQRINDLAKSDGANPEFFSDPENPPRQQLLFGQDLFGSKKLQVLEGLIKCYDFSGRFLDQLSESQNLVVFSEDKLDRRLASSKLLLADRRVKTEEFVLPHGNQLNIWLEKRVGEMGGAINPQATEILAVRIGRDESREMKFGGKTVSVEEVFDLWQADAEIKKLLAYAGDQEISVEAVKQLVPKREDADALGIVDAIAQRNKNAAFWSIERFLSSGGDDKARVIQLNALLSEQFRNLFILRDFLSRRVPDDQILNKTSWKPGRLFVLKKISQRFSGPLIEQTLSKLSALDQELKNSSTPPRIPLDLIVSQLFA